MIRPRHCFCIAILEVKHSFRESTVGIFASHASERSNYHEYEPRASHGCVPYHDSKNCSRSTYVENHLSFCLSKEPAVVCHLLGQAPDIHMNRMWTEALPTFYEEETIVTSMIVDLALVSAFVFLRNSG